jgi:hypothetical protein
MDFPIFSYEIPAIQINNPLILQASEESPSIPSAAPGPEFEDSGSSGREAEVDCSLPPD